MDHWHCLDLESAIPVGANESSGSPAQLQQYQPFVNPQFIKKTIPKGSSFKAEEHRASQPLAMLPDSLLSPQSPRSSYQPLSPAANGGEQPGPSSGIAEC